MVNELKLIQQTRFELHSCPAMTYVFSDRNHPKPNTYSISAYCSLVSFSFSYNGSQSFVQRVRLVEVIRQMIFECIWCLSYSFFYWLIVTDVGCLNNQSYLQSQNLYIRYVYIAITHILNSFSPLVNFPFTLLLPS